MPSPGDIDIRPDPSRAVLETGTSLPGLLAEALVRLLRCGFGGAGLYYVKDTWSCPATRLHCQLSSERV